MNVARIMLTMLNCMPHQFIMLSIHIQPTVRGRNDISASSSRLNEIHRNANTMNPHINSILLKSCDSELTSDTITWLMLTGVTSWADTTSGSERTDSRNGAKAPSVNPASEASRSSCSTASE